MPRGPGVPQVVPAQIVAARLCACPIPVAVQGRRLQVLAYLVEHGMEEFLRRKIEIDKAAMLGMPDRAADIPGVTIGSKGEEFVVEPAGAQEAGA